MVALSDNGKCNPFLSLWPRLTQTSFFPQLYLYFATCLVLPFISIWPHVCFLFYVRMHFVFLCIITALIIQANMIRACCDLKISAFQHTQSNRILSLTVEAAEIFYIWTNYCRTSARHFFLSIKLFLLFLVKTYRNCNCNFCDQPFISVFYSPRVACVPFVMPMHTEAPAARLCTFKIESMNTADDWGASNKWICILVKQEEEVEGEMGERRRGKRKF